MATIGQLMTRELSTIRQDASIPEAARQMVDNRIGSLLVKQGVEFSGIVTEADIVRAVADHIDVVQQSVKEIMSSPVLSIDRHLSPHYARDLMADRHIRHLGVTEGGTMVGIVSVRDLLAYFKAVSKPIS